MPPLARAGPPVKHTLRTIPPNIHLPYLKFLMGALSWSEHSKERHILKSNPKIKLYSDACIDMLQYTNQAFLEQKPRELFYKVQTDICILPVISNIKSKALTIPGNMSALGQSRKKSELFF
jgi:hypothetical protein